MTNNCQKKVTNNVTLPPPQHLLTLCHSLNMGPRRNIFLHLLFFRNKLKAIFNNLDIKILKIGKYHFILHGPVHFLKSFMHCCFIYHYKERCFPGEAVLNREAQNDKSLFGFHLSLTQACGPIRRQAAIGRPIRGHDDRGGVAQISSGPIHNFHCSRLGHLGFPLVHFLALLDLNPSPTLDFCLAGPSIKWRKMVALIMMKRAMRNLCSQMMLLE